MQIGHLSGIRPLRRTYRLLPVSFRQGVRNYWSHLKTLSTAKSPVIALIETIDNGAPLDSPSVIALSGKIERGYRDHKFSVADHAAVGHSIFSRSEDLYCGNGLPRHLARFTYPAFLGIAMNTHCNAACFFCRDGAYKGSLIEFDQIKKLELAIRNARAIDLTGWGEPFLYPRFEEVVRYVLSVNSEPHNIQITTNGSLLTKEWGRILRGHISKLVLSINAATAETYSSQMRYKSGAFTLEKTVKAIAAFLCEVDAEDRRRVTAHMVCNTDNYQEIGIFVKLAASLGIKSVNIGNFICADRSHMDKTLWHVKEAYNEELSRAEEIGKPLGVIVAGRRFFVDERRVMGAEACVAPFEAFFVETTGRTAPCCFAGNDRIGNVYDVGFDKTWFSQSYNRLRANRYLDACKVCTVFTPFDSETAHMSPHLTT